MVIAARREYRSRKTKDHRVRALLAEAVRDERYGKIAISIERTLAHGSIEAVLREAADSWLTRSPPARLSAKNALQLSSTSLTGMRSRSMSTINEMIAIGESLYSEWADENPSRSYRVRVAGDAELLALQLAGGMPLPEGPARAIGMGNRTVSRNAGVAGYDSNSAAWVAGDSSQKQPFVGCSATWPLGD